MALWFGHVSSSHATWSGTSLYRWQCPLSIKRCLYCLYLRYIYTPKFSYTIQNTTPLSDGSSTRKRPCAIATTIPVAATKVPWRGNQRRNQVSLIACKPCNGAPTSRYDPPHLSSLLRFLLQTSPLRTEPADHRSASFGLTAPRNVTAALCGRALRFRTGLQSLRVKLGRNLSSIQRGKRFESRINSRRCPEQY